MFRSLLAASLLLTSIPQAAWSASRSLTLPGGAAFNAPLGGGVVLPNLPNVVLPSIVAPVPGLSAGTGVSGVSATMPHSQNAVTAVQQVAQAAQAALQTSQNPGDAAADRGRVDFVDHQARMQDVSPVSPSVSGGLTAAPSSLEAPAHRGEQGHPVQPPASHRSGVRAYLSGVFGAQVANNALVVTLPAVLLGLGESLATVGFATALTTGFDMAGTLVSGWLTGKHSPTAVLTAATAARAATLSVIAVLAVAGALTAPLAIGLFAADALARGVADTARNTVPMTLVGKDKPALDSINSKYQTAFEAGGIFGPLLVGLLMLKEHAAAANWGVAAAFAVAAAAYAFVPRKAPPPAAAVISPRGESGKTPSKPKLSKAWLGLGIVATAVYSLAPALKGVIPAGFSESILHSPASASWLVLAFGLGGTLGALLYNRMNQRLSAKAWLGLGAAGTAVVAAGLLSGAFWPLAAAIFVFTLLNSGARLALTSSLQSGIPDGAESRDMGALRFTSNLSSMGSRAMLGLAFSAAAGPAAFAIVASALVLLAAGQAVASRYIRAGPPTLSKAHGMPGRLIIVEGLDGSGKSTQLELIKRDLESRGLKVVVTAWNSSEIVSEAVKKAKREKAMTPRVFAALNAADLADRMETTILPALREGAVVLADRWFYTALARDSVRGNDPQWLRSLYSDALKPDLALYFKAPVETAISRVMARSGKAGTSEDFEEEQKADSVSQSPKYYEAGLDLRLSEDPLENFKLFQTRVSASYDAQVKEFGLRAVDSSRTPEQIRAVVAPLVERTLSAAALRREEPASHQENLFDKDPAGDAENIRQNYQDEKKGAHFYFRNMLLPMQKRFAQLMDHSEMPRVFLHGSPHVDNMAKSLQGAAVVDFDRSRVGPYAWDLVRALVSISLRRKKMKDELLDDETAKQLLKGYLRGLRHPDKPFSEMRKLKNVEPKADEESMTAYLAANRKWAAELRANPIPVESDEVKTLMAGYGVPEGYFVAEAGRGQGSMGFREIYLVALRPLDPESSKDAILLNFKQVRADADDEWYKNPYPNQVDRMLAASALYAPGWDQNQGRAMLGGLEYHARAIPSMNAKLKKMLDIDDQRDFLYAVGTQLGRAHALSYTATGGDVDALEARAKKDFASVVDAGTVIRDEIVAAHKRYLKVMRDGGLEPKDDGDSDE